jgi:hypothetical protein
MFPPIPIATGPTALNGASQTPRVCVGRVTLSIRIYCAIALSSSLWLSRLRLDSDFDYLSATVLRRERHHELHGAVVTQHAQLGGFSAAVGTSWTPSTAVRGCASDGVEEEYFQTSIALRALLPARFRTPELVLQYSRKVLGGTRADQHVSSPAMKRDEHRKVSGTSTLPVVEIAQHSLQGLSTRQAGGKLGPFQLEVPSKPHQRRVRVVTGGPLLHPFEQQVVHRPELALVPGTLRRRGGRPRRDQGARRPQEGREEEVRARPVKLICGLGNPRDGRSKQVSREPRP